MRLSKPSLARAAGAAWRTSSAAVAAGAARIQSRAGGSLLVSRAALDLARLAFRPSLRTLVDRTVREHFRDNGALRPYRRSLPRRLMASARAHPVISVLLLTLAYTATCALTLLVSPEALGLKAHGDRVELQTINIGLLSAQAALVALVYPLVIAFIGVLFEPRTSRGGRMEVFLAETEAVATGGSALLLCGATSVFLVAMGHMPVRFSFAISVLNSAWFIGNLFGTAFFVARSIAYVRPSTRPALLRDFAAVSAWRDDLRTLVSGNRAAGAVRYGHLRDVATGLPPAAAGTALAFEMAAFGLSGDPAGAAAQLAEDSRVADLRFGWLEMAAHAWAFRNAAGVRAPGARGPRLRVRVFQGIVPAGPLALAEVVDGPPLNGLERRLVRRAYRFAPAGRNRRREPTRTASLLNEMAAELLPLIEGGRLFEFEAQMDSLVELHAFLFEIAAIPGSRERVSYAQFESPWLLMGKLGDDWARGYRDVIYRVVAKLPTEPGFFPHCAYLAANLHGQVASFAGNEALASVRRLAMTVVWALREWADGVRRRAATAAGGPGTAWELAGADGEMHLRAWRELVAGWERYGQAGFTDKMRGPPRLSAAEWDGLAAGSGHLLGHLESTAEMLAGCAFAGDLLGVRWSVDLVLKWKEANLGDQLGRLSHWPIDGLLLTPDLIGAGWDAVAAQVPEVSRSPGANVADLYVAVIGNAWLDVQFALACTLVRWAARSSPEGAAALAARHLLRREEYDPTGSADGSGGPMSMREFLACGMRVTVSSRSGGWGATVSSLMDSISRVEGRPMVSLRHYVTAGRVLDVGGIVHEQAICLAALSRGDCTMGEEIADAIGSVCKGEDLAARRLARYFGDLRDALAALDPEAHGPVAASVRGEPASGFPSWRDCAVGLVSECLSSVETARAERLRSAPIDLARLEEVSVAASSAAFSAATGGIPIPLFGRVALVSEATESFRLHSRVERGSLTVPLMSDGVRTDAGWWAKETRRAAAAVVMNDVVRLADRRDVVIADGADFWNALRQALASDPAHFLFVGPGRHMGWLHGWEQGQPPGRIALPADFAAVRPAAPIADGHVLDVNGTAVFRCPWSRGPSLIVPRALLVSVEFTDFGAGRAAEATYEDDNPPGEEGLLAVRFGRRVRLGSGTVHVLADEGDNGTSVVGPG